MTQSNSSRKADTLRRLAPGLAAFAFLCGAGNAVAQDASAGFIKPGEDVVTLNLGAVLNNFSTSVQFNGETGKGSVINLEDSGLSKDRTSFYASGTWRFLPNHRIDAQYWGVNRSASQAVSRDIIIDGKVIPVGASMSIENKAQIFTVDYRYSFLKNDDLEIAGVLGVYGGQFKYDLSATGTDGYVTKGLNKNASTTVPLPLIGATLDWFPDPRWRISADITGMKAKVGDVDGSVLLVAASTDYMLMRNLGIGARYMYSDVSATVTKSNFNGDLAFRTNAVMLYAKLMF